VPWQPKASAPAYFNLGEAFTALITGDTTWSWLLKWVPLIGDVSFQTSAFCSQGPSQTDPLQPSDFVTSSRNPIGTFINRAVLALKIRDAAYDRVFGAYCEQGLSAGWTSSANAAYAGVSIDIPVPAGANQIRTQCLAGESGGRLYWYGRDAANNTVWMGHNQDPPGPGPLYTDSIPAGMIILHIAGDSGAVRGTVQYSWYTPTGATAPYTPTPQPRPAGIVDPTSKVYNTIQDLGAELDALELKTEQTLDTVHWLALQTTVAASTTDTPIPAANGATKILPQGAVGFTVTWSPVPHQADEFFGGVPQYRRVGRITLGNANGWIQSIPLEHTPQLVVPLPAGVDRCVVDTAPGVSATVTPLMPPK
jgi:hypothetical protein